MRAVRLHTPAPIESGPLRLEERADLTPGPDELLLAVEACAVCRTDLQIVEGDVPARILPIVPGHQVVGRVMARGENVIDWREGDRAGIGWLAATCGNCRFCETGRENLCESAAFTGWDRDGGYADQAVVRADFALHLPAGRSALELAPLLCGGIIGYRSLRVSGIEPGGRLGLFGFGASASLAIQVALHRDCEVFVTTRSASERARARAMGATWAGNYDEPVPGPLDAAITFAPVGRVVVAALASLAPGGAVAVNAIHLDHIPEFDYDLLWQERQIRSVANYTRTDAEEFLALAPTLPIECSVQTYPFESAATALGDVKEGRTAGTAVLTG